MKRVILSTGLLLSAVLGAQDLWPPDSHGRQIVPHGFVTLTGLGDEFNYTLDDYKRMIPLGVNFQVIRLFAGKLGGWPGYDPDPKYLAKVDRMVAFGKQVGLQTAFKMTVYDIQGSDPKPLVAALRFGEDDWADFWRNKGGRQDAMIAAWRRLFEHFKNEASIVGYDLLNESKRTKLGVDDQTFAATYLVPYYRRLIDILHRIDPRQWVLFQPGVGVAVMPPLERERIVYAPHMYTDMLQYLANNGTPDPSTYAPALDRWQAQAAASHAALVLGEWSNPSILANEGALEKQQLFVRGEMAASAEFDRRVIGSIRPWFSGSAHSLNAYGRIFTWAVFYGDSEAGGPERKYILDIFARPFPLVIAGRIETFGFDFAKRRFEMKFIQDPTQGESEIFVPLGRHFPDGFRLLHSNGLILAYDASAPHGLSIIANPNRIDASTYGWDAARSRVVVRHWEGEKQAANVTIIPGVRD